MDKKEKIVSLWLETGGFITKSLASEISGLNKSQITQRIIKKELTEYHIDGIKTGFIAFNDAMKIKRKRSKNK